MEIPGSEVWAVSGVVQNFHSGDFLSPPTRFVSKLWIMLIHRYFTVFQLHFRKPVGGFGLTHCIIILPIQNNG